jgi:tRNA threonylcarbamoyladenosine biosynthesis protein TsaB
MKILALDTSSETASLALYLGGESRHVALPSPPAHSATLLPALQGLLAEAACPLGALDVIACGIGPGAFTGVRLACSVAQGLALAADLPVAPVCSLLALAQASEAESVYVAVDARMGEVYAAQYQRGAAGWRTLLAPCCVAPAQLPDLPDGDWIGVGSAFAAYADDCASLREKLLQVDAAARPDARALAALAVAQPWIDAAQLAPLYVRDRVAYTVAERLAAGGRA